MNIFKRIADKRKEQEKKEIKNEILKYCISILIAILIFVIIKFGILGRNYTISSIDLAKYTNLLNSKKTSLIYITTTDCTSCDEIENLVKKVLKGSNIKTYEINVGNLSDEDMDIFMNMSSFTKDGVATPSFIFVNDGQIESSLEMPIDEDIFIEYLKQNKLVD